MLFDLVDDDFIGQVKNVAPQGDSVSAQQQVDVDDDLSNTFYGNATAVSFLTTYIGKFGGDFYCQPVAVEVSHPCRIVYSCHFCSSGGIPL
jgi:hypothetical protein